MQKLTLPIMLKHILAWNTYQVNFCWLDIQIAYCGFLCYSYDNVRDIALYNWVRVKDMHVYMFACCAVSLAPWHRTYQGRIQIFLRGLELIIAHEKFKATPIFIYHAHNTAENEPKRLEQG